MNLESLKETLEWWDENHWRDIRTPDRKVLIHEIVEAARLLVDREQPIGSPRVIGSGVHYGGAVSVIRGRYRIEALKSDE